MVTHAEMVSTLKKPGEAIIASLTPQKADAWHMASCIPGEAAELYVAIRNKDKANALEELGDIQFYVEGLRQAYAIDRQDTHIPLDMLLETEVFPHDVVAFAGDIFDVVKKHVIYNKEFDRTSLITALAKFEYALAAASVVFDLTYEMALENNISKLSVRYKDLQYSDQAAQARADKQEVAEQNLVASTSTLPSYSDLEAEHYNKDA